MWGYHFIAFLTSIFSLSDFEKAEKEKMERDEAMNGLEALVYDLPIKLEDGEEFNEFVQPEEREKILAEVKQYLIMKFKLNWQVAKLRTWLEDEMSIETKTQEFLDHRKTLDDLIKAPNRRKKERLVGGSTNVNHFLL